ncbi:MAG TPA: type II CAAX endopeptidase family protein [Pleomorphomonadaceae bacterium]|nr:type II CAAX endopeptidase family protein [Pleomorphomonadaceae bacterium]
MAAEPPLTEPPLIEPPFAAPPPSLPPAWPAWVIAGLGLIVVLAGAAWLFYAASLGASARDWLVPGVLTTGGAAGLLGGLGWLAVRGVWARRHLPAERYRGPSIILMFFLAVAAANVLSLIPLLAAYAAGHDVLDPGPVAVTALLLVTPLVFGAVALFVLRTRALAGVRLGDGAKTARNLGRGLALGAVAWVLAATLAAALGWVVKQLTGEEPVDNQLVANLASTLPPLVAIGIIGILTPVAEELFFRWVAVNAWEREHGTRAAVIGSAVLFGVAHVSGGTLLVLPLIFLLGLALALAYVITRSLPLVIAMHVAFNSLSLLVLFAVGV